MSGRLTASLMALIGIVPVAVDAAPPAKAAQNLVLYDQVTFSDPNQLVPSASIDTSRFQEVSVLASGVGHFAIVCYFTEAPASDPRDVAGILAFAGTANEGLNVSNGLLVAFDGTGEPQHFMKPLPVLSNYLQCLAAGEPGTVARAVLSAR